jgi:ubiquinone/menaquinone biosynthesis C-methylase UbiE
MPRQVSDRRAQRLRRYWDRHARNYDKQTAFWERRLFGDGRQWVCAQASGEVLEVAIGTGRNLPYYPEGIRLTGIEFSPAMLELARRQADRLGRKVDLRLGDAQALDLPDASLDTVVCTLSLCAIPDERRAVAEMRRVLRPGGRLLLLDHVAGLPRWSARSNGCWSRSPGHSAKSTCGAAHSGRYRQKGSRSNGGNASSSASSNG